MYDKADNVHQAFLAYLEELDSAYKNKVEFGEKDLENLESLQGDLGEFKDRTVIVTFLVLEDNISIIVTSPTIQLPFRIPVHKADLNRKVFDFREILVLPDRDPRPQAQALYELLFPKIEADLAALEAETLMVSLDGALRYMPFAALFDGERYLAERYNLVLFTPAAKTLFGEAKERKLSIAAMGMSDAAEGFGSLPAVEEELDLIVKEDDENDLRGGPSRQNSPQSEFYRSQLFGHSGAGSDHPSRQSFFIPARNSGKLVSPSRRRRSAPPAGLE